MKEKNLSNKKHNQHQHTTPEPEFMNDVFCLFLKIVNFLAAVYIIISIILYLVIHFNGKDLFKSRKSYIEYDRLLFLNLFYDIFLGFTITFSYLAIYKKSNILFVVYFGFMILACVFGFFGYSQDFDKLNSKIRYVVLTIFGLNIIFVIYPIFHYLRKIQYFRVSLEAFPVENIIHEVNLRTDMMKMGFNNFVINMKLNKLLPGITFKKEDYYFMSEECKNRSAYRPINNKDGDDKEDRDEDTLTHTQYGSKSTSDDRNIDSIKTS